GIDPQTIRKAVSDILSMIRPDERAPVPGSDRRNRKRDKIRSDFAELPADELTRLIRTLEEEMKEAAADLRFEYAARLRDEIGDLKKEMRELHCRGRAAGAQGGPGGSLDFCPNRPIWSL